MPIGISDEHAELAASVRKWAESQGAIDAVRAAETDPGALADWGPRASELGLAAIALPESVGGGGGTLLDQAVALEAAAYALVPGPLLTTVVNECARIHEAIYETFVAYPLETRLPA